MKQFHRLYCTRCRFSLTFGDILSVFVDTWNTLHPQVLRGDSEMMPDLAHLNFETLSTTLDLPQVSIACVLFLSTFGLSSCKNIWLITMFSKRATYKNSLSSSQLFFSILLSTFCLSYDIWMASGPAHWRLLQPNLCESINWFHIFFWNHYLFFWVLNQMLILLSFTEHSSQVFVKIGYFGTFFAVRSRQPLKYYMYERYQLFPMLKKNFFKASV